MNINELHFDNKNANKHTPKGLKLLEKSLQTLGAGRSILIDKDNNIIAGNGVVEVAGQIGLDKIRVIETDGNEIIAVRRKDITINSKKGRDLALADNQTAKVGIDFDFDVIDELNEEYDFDFGANWEIVSLDFAELEEAKTKEPTFKITLNYNETDYNKVKDALLEHGTSYEDAVYNLLNI
jgi:hypothetical protein